MPKGPSGRVVIEIDPQIKKRLHAVLECEGRTLKDWFLHNAKEYIFEGTQLKLELDRPLERHGSELS